jgi:hypothetical protein
MPLCNSHDTYSHDTYSTTSPGALCLQAVVLPASDGTQALLGLAASPSKKYFAVIEDMGPRCQVRHRHAVQQAGACAAARNLLASYPVPAGSMGHGRCWHQGCGRSPAWIHLLGYMAATFIES